MLANTTLSFLTAEQIVSQEKLKKVLLNQSVKPLFLVNAM